MIFLMYIAGRSPKTGEADPRALNKLPLDLYLAVAAAVTLFGCMAIYELVEEIFGKNTAITMFSWWYCFAAAVLL